ncbi:MAG: T9SS type A sorting domain-containing protein, partial [Bacteroidales bacterium]|nr:T9SS type A sorting domain-containing protein [Bacteroidales bacterium]
DTITSLSFNVFSSDQGNYGINTPTYFCLDDIVYTTINNKIQNITNQQITVFPNPTANFITFSENITEAYFFDLTGKLILITNQNTVNVSDFSAGSYIIKAKLNNQYLTTKFIKF